jgi:hypothetical protein
MSGLVLFLVAIAIAISVVAAAILLWLGPSLHPTEDDQPEHQHKRAGTPSLRARLARWLRGKPAALDYRRDKRGRFRRVRRG